MTEQKLFGLKKSDLEIANLEAEEGAVWCWHAIQQHLQRVEGFSYQQLESFFSAEGVEAQWAELQKL
jgi:hypothetical protein